MTTFRKLLLIPLTLLLAGCVADDEPAATCTEGGNYEIPATTQVVNAELSVETDNGNYWVCSGGSLTLSGRLNTVLIEEGGTLTINGNENVAYALGGSELIIHGDEQTVWLNGESKTTVRGDNNFLYYYRTGVLLEYGQFTKVEDLCGNVEIDRSKAPESGCL